MKIFLIIWGALFVAGCAGDPRPACNPGEAKLIEPLRPYVRDIAGSLDKVPLGRRALLDEIAAKISELLQTQHSANLTFICTHNSRRSHMSQIWAQTAACYYGLERVRAFSGGTEATACNSRTVAAMRRAGFSVVKTADGANPVYLVQYSEDEPPIRAYSKLYNEEGNPKLGFIALMTCSQADKKCPVVEGAVARYAIHYADPKLCDDTPDEPVAYDARCREIAREMFYMLSRARERLDQRGARP